MAFDLVAAFAESTEPFYVRNSTSGTPELSQAVQQITLRFSPGASIDSSTLADGITILRSGGGGDFFGNGNDLLVVPGGVTVDDLPNENQITIRFTETLADDSYRIRIDSDLLSLPQGAAPADSFDGEFDLDFRVDIGAQVVSVVPQPVIRAKTIRFDAVPASGDRLAISVRGLGMDFVFSAAADAVEGTVDTSTGATVVRTAGRSASQVAAAVRELLVDGGGAPEADFGGEASAITVSGRSVTVTGVAFTPIVSFTRSGAVPAGVVTVGDGALAQLRNTVIVHFNVNDPLDEASAETVANYRLFQVNPTTGAEGAPISPASVSYDVASGTAVLRFLADLADDRLLRLQVGDATTAPPVPVVFAPPSDDNSSFYSASATGQLTADGLVIDSRIDLIPLVPTPVGDLPFPTQPGSIDDVGHRDVPVNGGGEQHGAPGESGTTAAAAIVVQPYNFASYYGDDPQGNPLYNAITETQKQRAREIFEIYSRYAGIRFIETDSQGIQVITGDMRALDPLISTAPAGLAGGNRAIMDSTENWGDSEYGGAWFQVAMHEIGHVLGLAHSYDIPSNMGAPLPDEFVFPGDYDLEHFRQLYPANGSDIDIYSFTLADDGRLTAETVVARPGSPITSTLDTVLTLYRENAAGEREMVARNDDYYGRDSLIDLDLAALDGDGQPYTYFVAVTSTGNTAFDPEVENSGYGGRTQGDYRLQLSFAPVVAAAGTIVDATGTKLDGDRNGEEGGAFDFWFNTASVARTVFVDKVAAAGGTGTLAAPFNTISAALAAVNAENAATPGSRTVVRIVGNDGNASSPDDDRPYLIGRAQGQSGTVLADGATFNVPRDVTVMIDEAALVKLRGAIIDVGSSSLLPSASRQGAALQVLGTPGRNVRLTSYHDDTLGGSSDGVGPAASGGQWGGIVLRRDSDTASRTAFVNSITNAELRYGGGQVLVDSVLQSFTPIHLVSARPTLAFNRVFGSAGAAMSADPNSFEDDGDRFGPEIRGNTLADNSINGMFVRIDTPAGGSITKLTVPARFKSRDVVYVIAENLVIAGGAGGYERAGGVDRARAAGRLTIDPGVTVKLRNARIELEIGTSRLYAEGLPGSTVVFTSLNDNRYGAGGTFDTNGNQPDTPAAGDWGGLLVRPEARASIDNAYIAFGGGTAPIEGGFAEFNVLEVHQGDLRVANSRIERNDAGYSPADGVRVGRGPNAQATVFARGAQPVIVGNDFRENIGATVSINVNALSNVANPDPGRSTGLIGREPRFDDNVGPLVRDNRISSPINFTSRRKGDFEIELEFDPTLSLDVQQAVRAAADRWETIIVGDVADEFSAVTTSRVLGMGTFVNGAVTNSATIPVDDTSVARIGAAIFDSAGTQTGFVASIDSVNSQVVLGLRTSVNGAVNNSTVFTVDDASVARINAAVFNSAGTQIGTVAGINALNNQIVLSAPVSLPDNASITFSAPVSLADNALIAFAVGAAPITGRYVLLETPLSARTGAPFDASGERGVVIDSIDGIVQLSASITASNNETISFGVDDIRIRVQPGLLGGSASDGADGTLANAGPTAFRGPTSLNPSLPYLGEIGIDMADVDSRQLIGVLAHEIGHALGFTVTSNLLSLIENDLWTGENAIREFLALGFTGAGVPIETGYGVGTAGSHWDEAAFANELMTGLIDNGINPLTRLTVGAFEDMGYQVSYLAADPYLTGLAASALINVSGMEVRGGEVTVEGVWDDTDIVHVVRDEIIVNNFHTATGLRLQSASNGSLVVKFRGVDAGLTAAGFGLAIDDRIGGTVQVVGQPGYPVVLTSLFDDTVYASLDPLGVPVRDTNNDGVAGVDTTATLPGPGDWRGLRFLELSNDRNVSIMVEAELAFTEDGRLEINADTDSAQLLGILAPNFATGTNTWESAQEKAGDDNRRLGFEVHGAIAYDNAADVDVYRFSGYAGSEVWIDVDNTTTSLDAMLELLDADGNVLARSADSLLDTGSVRTTAPDVALENLGGQAVVQGETEAVLGSVAAADGVAAIVQGETEAVLGSVAAADGVAAIVQGETETVLGAVTAASGVAARVVGETEAILGVGARVAGTSSRIIGVGTLVNGAVNNSATIPVDDVSVARDGARVFNSAGAQIGVVASVDLLNSRVTLETPTTLADNAPIAFSIDTGAIATFFVLLETPAAARNAAPFNATGETGQVNNITGSIVELDTRTTASNNETITFGYTVNSRDIVVDLADVSAITATGASLYIDGADSGFTVTGRNTGTGQVSFTGTGTLPRAIAPGDLLGFAFTGPAPAATTRLLVADTTGAVAGRPLTLNGTSITQQIATAGVDATSGVITLNATFTPTAGDLLGFGFQTDTIVLDTTDLDVELVGVAVTRNGVATGRTVTGIAGNVLTLSGTTTVVDGDVLGFAFLAAPDDVTTDLIRVADSSVATVGAAVFVNGVATGRTVTELLAGNAVRLSGDVTIDDGDLIGFGFVGAGSITTTRVRVADTTGITVGVLANGFAGVPGGTRVAAVDAATGTVDFDAAVTIANANVLGFGFDGNTVTLDTTDLDGEFGGGTVAVTRNGAVITGVSVNSIVGDVVTFNAAVDVADGDVLGFAFLPADAVTTDLIRVTDSSVVTVGAAVFVNGAAAGRTVTGLLAGDAVRLSGDVTIEDGDLIGFGFNGAAITTTRVRVADTTGITVGVLANGFAGVPGGTRVTAVDAATGTVDFDAAVTIANGNVLGFGFDGTTVTLDTTDLDGEFGGGTVAVTLNGAVIAGVSVNSIAGDVVTFDANVDVADGDVLGFAFLPGDDVTTDLIRVDDSSVATVGADVFLNGVDTGVDVAAGGLLAGNAVRLTADITIEDGDLIGFGFNGAAITTTRVRVADTTGIDEDVKVTLNGVDTGFRVAVGGIDAGSGTVTLTGGVAVAAADVLGFGFDADTLLDINGDTQIRVVNAAGISPGVGVGGVGITAGTTVLAVDPVNNTITFDQAVDLADGGSIFFLARSFALANQNILPGTLRGVIYEDNTAIQTFTVSLDGTFAFTRIGNPVSEAIAAASSLDRDAGVITLGFDVVPVGTIRIEAAYDFAALTLDTLGYTATGTNGARPLDRDDWNGSDTYSLNPRNPGMRVVLPGATGELTQYYIRVRSQPRQDSQGLDRFARDEAATVGLEATVVGREEAAIGVVGVADGVAAAVAGAEHAVLEVAAVADGVAGIVSTPAGVIDGLAARVNGAVVGPTATFTVASGQAAAIPIGSQLIVDGVATGRLVQAVVTGTGVVTLDAEFDAGFADGAIVGFTFGSGSATRTTSLVRVSDVAGLAAGLRVTGTGLPTGLRIVAITADATGSGGTVELSSAIAASDGLELSADPEPITALAVRVAGTATVVEAVTTASEFTVTDPSQVRVGAVVSGPAGIVGRVTVIGLSGNAVRVSQPVTLVAGDAVVFGYSGTTLTVADASAVAVGAGLLVNGLPATSGGTPITVAAVNALTNQITLSAALPSAVADREGVAFSFVGTSAVATRGVRVADVTGFAEGERVGGEGVPLGTLVGEIQPDATGSGGILFLTTAVTMAADDGLAFAYPTDRVTIDSDDYDGLLVGAEVRLNGLPLLDEAGDAVTVAAIEGAVARLSAAVTIVAGDRIGFTLAGQGAVSTDLVRVDDATVATIGVAVTLDGDATGVTVVEVVSDDLVRLSGPLAVGDGSVLGFAFDAAVIATRRLRVADATGIQDGVLVNGVAGVPAGTRVASVDAATRLVTLEQSVTVADGDVLGFGFRAASLTIDTEDCDGLLVGAAVTRNGQVLLDADANPVTVLSVAGDQVSLSGQVDVADGDLLGLALLPAEAITTDRIRIEDTSIVPVDMGVTINGVDSGAVVAEILSDTVIRLSAPVAIQAADAVGFAFDIFPIATTRVRVADLSGIVVGSLVNGVAGIPAGTRVTAVTPEASGDGGTVEFSQAATLRDADLLGFGFVADTLPVDSTPAAALAGASVLVDGTPLLDTSDNPVTVVSVAAGEVVLSGEVDIADGSVLGFSYTTTDIMVADASVAVVGDVVTVNGVLAGRTVAAILPGNIVRLSGSITVRPGDVLGFAFASDAERYEASLTSGSFAEAGDPAAGASSGGYELRVRLRQQDEKPGSTVRFADIRYPVVGIDVVGLPRNSLLAGENGENASDTNGGLATAQELGNLLATDRNTISVAGSMAGEADVDWYSFTLDYRDIQSIGGVNSAGKTWATLFDIDYADGFRGDLTLSVFDSAGRLLYVGRDSDITDDQPGIGQANDFDDLSRGSLGKLDPFIGTVQMPAGGPGSSTTYYVAVSSNERLPTALNATFTGSALNPLIRLEPINSLSRIVEDRIEITGYDALSPLGVGDEYRLQPETGAIIDVSSATTLAANVRPFTLADVTLFVSTGSSLVTVDAFSGGVETRPGDNAYTNGGVGDIDMRTDGRLFLYYGQNGDTANNGVAYEVDTGNGQIGRADLLSYGDGISNDPDTATFWQITGQSVDALAIGRTGVATYNDSFFYSIREQSTVPPAARPGDSILYHGRSASNNSAAYIENVWSGRIGEIGGNLGGTDVIGHTTGMQFRNDQSAQGLFGVSDTGRFYSIATGTAAATGLVDFANVPIPASQGGGTLGGFGGLAAAPVNLEGGRYQGSFFAITTSGRLVVITDGDPAAGFQPALMANVFDSNGDGYADSYVSNVMVGGATGLAFSPLDVNLWHPTNRRGDLANDPVAAADPGHGVNAAFDNTRLEEVGGASMYFGLEDYDTRTGGYATLGGPGQYGTTSSRAGVGHGYNWQEELTAGGSRIGNNYNLPGGAFGSLITNPFSLSGYSYTDKPVLYFNYFLETEGAGSTADGMRDSARVFLSTDDGLTWQVVATNNSPRSTNDGALVQDAELPSRASTSSAISSQANQHVQELFDSTGGWRQARVDLGKWAGESNIRLRFDFSTAGEMDPNDDSSATPDAIAAVAGAVTAGTSVVPLGSVEGLQVGMVVNTALDAAAISGNTGGFTTVAQRILPGTTIVAIDSSANTVTLSNATGAALAGGDQLRFFRATALAKNGILGMANTTGDLGSAGRGANNAFEGFYIDDIVVGFAERGEMVTGAVADQTAFFALNTPVAGNYFEQVLQGPYQLEIRRGTEYAWQPSTGDSQAGIYQVFDTNDRLVRADAATVHILEQNPFSVIDGAVLSARGSGSIGAAGGVANGVTLAGLGDATSPTEHNLLTWAVDLANEPSAFLEFQYRTGTEESLAPLPATFRLDAANQLPYGDGVAVSTDGGTTWRTIANFTSTRNAWRQVRLDLADAAGPLTAQTVIGFFQSGPRDDTDTDNRRGGISIRGVAYDPDTGLDGFGARNVLITTAPRIATSGLVGDSNLRREQGQFLIESNIISFASQFGISVDAGDRDAGSNAPYPGVARNLPTLNNDRLVPGVAISNNILNQSGQAGILFSGQTNAGNLPSAVVPFGRVFNNTFYGGTTAGGATAAGTGVVVTDNAAPTLLNNLFVNLATGVSVDGSSANATEIGYTGYYGVTTQVTGGTQTDVVILAEDPFVNPEAGNFYLVPQSDAIDTALNGLQDRNDFAVVKDGVGIPQSPILAPDRDLYGQLRADDPDMAGYLGGTGNNVFKDLGAVDRVDFTQPRMELADPLDGNVIAPVDRDPAGGVVRLELDQARGVTQFVIQLSDIGVGIDTSTVTAENFIVRFSPLAGIGLADWLDPARAETLEEGLDYLFRYLETTNEVVFESAAVFQRGEYRIEVVDRAVSDLAGNRVLVNDVAGTGSTAFRLALVDVPSEPGAVTATLGDTTVVAGDETVTLTWSESFPNGAAVLSYEIERSDDGGATWLAPVVIPADLPLETTITGLSNGATYLFRLRSRNEMGYGPYSTILPVTALATPVLGLAADTGSDPADGVTNNRQITVDGLAAGSTWEYRYFSGGVFSGWLAGTGATLDLPATDAIYGIADNGVEVRQMAGTPSHTSLTGTNPERWTIDLTPPPAPVIAFGTGVDNGATADEATQSGGVVTIEGELDATITVTFTGEGGLSVTKTVTGAGAGNPVAVVLDEATDGDLTTIGTGVVTVTARQTDLAGNIQTAPDATDSFLLDITPPDAPTLSVDAAIWDPPADPVINIDEATRPEGIVVVQGELDATITVTFSVNGGGTLDKSVTGTGAAQPVVLTLAELNRLGQIPGGGTVAGLVDLLVSAVQTDKVGNAQTDPPVELTISWLDGIPPAAPVITLGSGVENGATEAEATQLSGVVTVEGELDAMITLTFTGEAGEVTKTVTGAGAGNPVAVVLDEATDDDLTTLGDGAVTVSAAQISTTGNTSAVATLVFNLDRSAPAAATVALGTGVAALPDGGATEAEATQLSGVVTVEGELDATITVTFTGAAGEVTKTVTGAGAGNPVAVVLDEATDDDLTTLGEGDVMVSVTQADRAGNVQAASAETVIFTLDTVAPTAPVVALVDGVGDGITLAEATAAEGLLTVTGEAGASMVVTLVGQAGTVVLGPFTASGGADPLALGSADVTTLGDGAVTLSAVQTDAAGNVSDPGTASFTLDTVAPGAPALALAAGVLAPINIAEATLPTGVVTVSGEAGATIVVVFKDAGAGGAELLRKSVTGAGLGVLVSVVLDEAELPLIGSGFRRIEATQTDAAGNPQQVSATTLTVTFDVDRPVAPVLALGAGVANGATAAEATQVSGVVTVRGESGARIRLTFTGSDGEVEKEIPSASGAVQAVPLLAADLLTLGEGPVTVEAVQTDAAGNDQADPPATADFTLDTIAPAAATIVPATGIEPSPSLNGASFAEATDPNGIVFVTGETGATIVVTFSRTGGGTISRQVSGDGANPVPVTLSAANLATLGNGTIRASVRQTDVAGNVQEGIPAEISFRLDTVFPAAPALLYGPGVFGGATRAEATQTQQGTPPNTSASGVVSVRGEPDAAIDVTFTGEGGGEVTRSLTGTGGNQFITLSDADVDELGDGVVIVTSIQADASGNIGPRSTLSFTIDSIPPEAPSIALGIGVADGATRSEATQASGVVVVSGEAGLGLTVIFTGTNGTVTKTFDSMTATQAVSLSTADVNTLGNGPVAVAATVVDAAGNEQTGGPAMASFVIDTVAPSAAQLARGTGVADGATRDEATQASGVVTVIGEQSAAVTVEFRRTGGGTVVKTVEGTGAAQAVELTSAEVDAIGDGTVTVTARQTDAAGNAQTATSASLTFNLDTTAPGAPTILAGTGIEDGATLAELTQSSGAVRVIGEANASIEVDFWGRAVDRHVVKTVTGTGASQPVSLTAAEAAFLGDGVVTAYAKQTDRAGNMQAESRARLSFTVDTTPPAAPTLALAEGVTSPMNAGTATRADGIVSVTGEPGATITVRLSRNGGGTITRTLTGTGSAQAIVLSAADVTTLGNGDVVVTASQIDAAGNAQVAASSSLSFRLDTLVPAAPTLALGPGVADGASKEESLQEEGVVTVRGEAGAAIVVTFTGPSGFVVTKNLVGTGSALPVVLSTSNIRDLGNGTITVRARQTDAAGNAQTAAAARLTFTLDTRPPSAPRIYTASRVRNGATAAEAVASWGFVSVRADADAPVDIDIVGAGGDVVTRSFTGNGSVQPIVLTATEVALLGDGPLTVGARQTDRAGNTSNQRESTVTLDTTAPEVTGLFTARPDGVYAEGRVIGIQVRFSEAVYVTGRPYLELNTSPARIATYAGGNGTDTVLFNYTVAVGDTSPDLDVASSSALMLNGGTIRDRAGNSVIRRVPGPGGSGSLGAGHDIVVAAPIRAVVAGFSANPSSPTPVSGAVRELSLSFNGPVTGVGTAAMRLYYQNVLISLATATVTGSGSRYTLSLPSNLTSLPGDYHLEIGGVGSGIRNPDVEMSTVSAVYWRRQ